MLFAAASRRFVLSSAKIPLSRRRPPREIRLGSSAGLRPADLRYQRLRLGGLAKPRQQPPFGSSRTDSVNSHEAHQHHDPCREFGNGGDRPAQDEAARIEQRVREKVGAELVRRDVILIGRAVCDRIDVEEEASRAEEDSLVGDVGHSRRIEQIVACVKDIRLFAQCSDGCIQKPGHLAGNRGHLVAGCRDLPNHTIVDAIEGEIVNRSFGAAGRADQNAK
jgi:hypothetical protein